MSLNKKLSFRKTVTTAFECLNINTVLSVSLEMYREILQGKSVYIVRNLLIWSSCNVVSYLITRAINSSAAL